MAKTRGLGRGLDALLSQPSSGGSKKPASTLPIDLLPVSYTHLTLPTSDLV